MFYKYEHLVIRCFFAINWFSRFGYPKVIFLFEFKEFSLRNQISILTALLLYIFAELFSYGWFRDWLLFSIEMYEGSQFSH